MLFVILCTDKPESLELRLKVRPEHLAYLNGLGDGVKLAGPFLDEAGSPVGSLIIVEAGDRAAAEAISANDPSSKAGLFASVAVKPWKWTIKNPEG